MSSGVTVARHNVVLNALADPELERLLPYLEQRTLVLGDVLYRAGEPVPGVQFPITGVVSVTTRVDPDHRVEVATIGLDGVVGLPSYLGAGAPTETAGVQVPGTALTMTTAAFREAVARVDGPLDGAMRRYSQVMFTQLATNAACTRVHQIGQRTARWLLTAADRMPGDTFELTQGDLAQALAVRRSSVNEVARALADAGAISYTRGVVTVRNRRLLHAGACACYDVLRRATGQAFPPA